MIIWLEKKMRSHPISEPLHRVGYLEGKNNVIDRVFDHLAFSCLLDTPMDVLIKSNDEEKRVVDAHCALAMPGDHRIMIPQYPVNEFFFVFEESSIPRLFNGVAPKHYDCGIMPINEPQKAELQTYMNLMLKLLDTRLTPDICLQLDMLALGMLAATFWKNENDNQIIDDPRLLRAENFIVRNYHKQIDLEILASNFGMSYATFLRHWQKKNKQTPYAFIMELRNREAKELLMNRNLSIGTVAEQTGFKDARYFSRFFHAANGMTPTEFRNNRR